MGARILLIEDDPGIGTALRMNLEYERYDVVWARDLRTARQSAGDGTFDLVLMDRGLPDGDGLLTLAENGTGVVTREQVMSQLDADGEITDRTLDSHLSHVRRKLRKLGVDSIQIISVYGVGYTLEKR